MLLMIYARRPHMVAAAPLAGVAPAMLGGAGLRLDLRTRRALVADAEVRRLYLGESFAL